MKTHHLALALATMLFGGCAGYNHTLFMTKSNAGLDFDAKPPTAEATISRKEAVIAPAFEGAQTPPVMASFKPVAGAGRSFFMGVDQTFAGGDAALAMATLYDSESVGSGTELFDSSLHLQAEPQYNDVFRRIAKPGQVKPFIFGTDTMLGMKVAWSGVGGQFPDTLKAGFNRKEFAWAPLTMKEEQSDPKYVVKMPAFLATIQSSQRADSTDMRIEALQYFSTGDAATLLALQPEVRKAMIRRADPNAMKQALEYERLKTNVEEQKNALQTIVDEYEAAGEGRQGRILGEAIQKGIVPPGTTREKFVDVLIMQANLADDDLTQKLNALAQQVNNL